MHFQKWLGLALVAVLALAGCGDDAAPEHGEHEHGGEFSDDCQAIIDACHEVDDGRPGEIATCHEEIAHMNIEAECTAMKTRCVALCDALAADAGLLDDDGGYEESADDHAN